MLHNMIEHVEAEMPHDFWAIVIPVDAEDGEEGIHVAFHLVEELFMRRKKHESS